MEELIVNSESRVVIKKLQKGNLILYVGEHRKNNCNRVLLRYQAINIDEIYNWVEKLKELYK